MADQPVGLTISQMQMQLKQVLEKGSPDLAEIDLDQLSQEAKNRLLEAFNEYKNALERAT